MTRWEPNARGRLEEAALELFEERGFEQTTAAAIADRAGLTERTFFRHFADKREVLFSGTADLQELLRTTIAEAPAAASPMDAVSAALEAAGAWSQGRADRARRRQAIIAAHPGLRERELIKLAALAALMAGALRDRGVAEPGASLAAEAGTAAFRVAFERWIAEGQREPLTDHIRAAVGELRAVAAA